MDRRPDGANVSDRLEVERTHGTSIINRRYSVIRTLGQGQYGRVKLCLDLHDLSLCAIKICSKAKIRASMNVQLSSQRSMYVKRIRARTVASRRNKSFDLPTSEASSRSCGNPSRPAFPGHRGTTAPAQPPIAESEPRSFTRSQPGQSHVADAFVAASQRLCHSGLGGVASGTVSDGGLSTVSDFGPISREIAILKKLDHPNVVRLLAAIDDPGNDNLLLVMDHVEGGSLEQPRLASGMWASVEEDKVRGWVRDIVQGLDYLYRNGVIHGDLKPANLLLTADGHVKLADFGSAVLFNEEQEDGCLFGTPAFRAPESLESGYRLSPEADAWALGVCIYVWIYGCLPFDGNTPYAIYNAIRTCTPEPPSQPSISSELQSVLAQLLQKRPDQRMSASQMMQHPWLTEGGTRPLTAALNVYVHVPTAADCSSAIMRTDANEQAMLTLMETVFMERVLAPGEVLFRAGERIEQIFLIAEGEVELFVEAADAAETEPAVFVMTAEREQRMSMPGCSHTVSCMSSEASDLSAEGFGNEREAAEALLRTPGVDTHMANLSVVNHSTASSSPSHLHGDLIMQVCHVGVYSAGESLGLSALRSRSEAPQLWASSGRAAGIVKVIEAQVSQVARLAAQHQEVGTGFERMLMRSDHDHLIADALQQLQVRRLSSSTRGAASFDFQDRSLVSEPVHHWP